MRTHSLHISLLAPVILAACASSPEDPSVGSSRQSIIARGDPAIVDYTSSPPPALAVTGTANFSYDQTGADYVHGLQFTNGNDDGAPPATYANATDYYSTAAGYPGTDAYASDVNAALTRASSDLTSKIDDKGLADLAKVLNLIPGVSVGVVPTATRVLGYTPIQARWLKSKYSTTASLPSPLQKKFEYPAPRATAELRERGARLYCAARRAIREQMGRPNALLGEQVALPLSVFGQKIDIGVVQASLAIDGPEKWVSGPKDGGQAFEIPFLAGARVIPVRGVSQALEQIPELRHPIVLVSGDSEMLTRPPTKSIPTSRFLFCWAGSCNYIYSYTTDYPETYLTAKHADAIGTAAAGLDWHSNFPLFTTGILSVNLDLTANLDIGKPVALPTAPLAPLNDRLFPEWGAVPRTGDVSSTGALSYFDDLPWTRVSGSNSSLNGPLTVNSGFGTLPVLYPGDSMQMRALANDDHHVATQSGLHLDAKVVGAIGATMGPMVIDMTASGSLLGDFYLQHHVRDGVSLLHGDSGGSFPVTNLMVTPQTNAAIGLKFNVGMHLHLDLKIKSLDYDVDLLTEDTRKDYGGTPWPESRRLRIGTGRDTSDADTTSNRPPTVSHLPAPAGASMSLYDSFSLQTVDQCLSDTTTNPKPPAACGPANGPVSTPHANVCVYVHEAPNGSTWPPTWGFGTHDQWGGACTSPSLTAEHMAGGTSSPAYACYRDLLTYACSSTSHTLDSLGGVSHIMELSNPADGRLANAIQTCVDAAPGVDPKALVGALLGFQLCDDTAHLLDPAHLIVPGSTKDNTTPEDVRDVASCN